MFTKCIVCGDMVHEDEVCVNGCDDLLDEYFDDRVNQIYDVLDLMHEGRLHPRVTVQIDSLDGFHTVTL